MVVRADGRIAGQHPQHAGHAQVQQRAVAGIGVHQQVLGPAADRGDAAAGQLFADLGGNRPAQVGPAQDHAGDPSPLHVRGQAAAGGFDLGKFGHGQLPAAAR